MAKGKYSTRAAKTRDVTALALDIARLEHEKEKMQQQMDSRESEAASYREFAESTISRLKLENIERTNGEINSIKEMNSILRAELDDAAAEMKHIKNAQNKMVSRMLNILRGKLSLSWESAVELLASETADARVTIDWDGVGQHVGENPELVRTLRNARNMSSGPR